MTTRRGWALTYCPPNWQVSSISKTAWTGPLPASSPVVVSTLRLAGAFKHQSVYIGLAGQSFVGAYIGGVDGAYG